MIVNEIHDALVNAYVAAATDCKMPIGPDYLAEVQEEFKEQALRLDTYVDGYNKGCAITEISMREKYGFTLNSHKAKIAELEKEIRHLQGEVDYHKDIIDRMNEGDFGFR
jgi:hypothetical protein